MWCVYTDVCVCVYMLACVCVYVCRVCFAVWLLVACIVCNHCHWCFLLVSYGVLIWLWFTFEFCTMHQLCLYFINIFSWSRCQILFFVCQFYFIFLLCYLLILSVITAQRYPQDRGGGGQEAEHKDCAQGQTNAQERSLCE